MPWWTDRRGPAWTVGRHAEVALIDAQAHLAESARAAARGRAPDHAESQPFDDLGDQLAVAMFADQDVHLGPVPVIGREEHDLVEKRVDIALAGRAGHLGVDSGVFVPEVVLQRASQLPDQGGRRLTRWPGPGADAGFSWAPASLSLDNAGCPYRDERASGYAKTAIEGQSKKR